MKIIIINSAEYPWDHFSTDEYSIFLKGYYWINNTYYEGTEGARLIIKLLRNKNIGQIQNVLSESLTGHFAAMIEGPSFALAFVDRIRSIPLFFSKTNDQLIFSNSAHLIQNELDDLKLDDESLIMFKMTGYCLHNQTLHKNIKQLKSGQFIYTRQTEDKIILKHYYLYFNFENTITKKEILIEKLHKVTIKTFEKMIDSLRNKQIMVPLSGGYDSRLIIAILKDFGYNNVKAYTYGIKNIWEVKRAKYIANYLNIDCIHIEFNPSKTRKLFKEKIRKEYFRYAGGLNSAPHLPDFYAILKMQSLGILKDETIFINGQSGDFITGGHLPKLLNEDERNIYGWEELFNVIINQHFSLWNNLKTEKNKSIIIEWLSKTFDSVTVDELNKENFSKLYELFEFGERQSKFVVNGQRIYEFFGYDWRLPLWSDELMEFWKTVPWSFKYGQRLYLDYLKEMNFGGVFKNISLPHQYSYFPSWSFGLRILFKTLSYLSGKEIGYYYNKYLKYHMTYAPFYPQESYLRYLKDSTYHRNPISYSSKEYIKELDEN